MDLDFSDPYTRRDPHPPPRSPEHHAQPSHTAPMKKIILYQRAVRGVLESGVWVSATVCGRCGRKQGSFFLNKITARHRLNTVVCRNTGVIVTFFQKSVSGSAGVMRAGGEFYLASSTCRVDRNSNSVILLFFRKLLLLLHDNEDVRYSGRRMSTPN